MLLSIDIGNTIKTTNQPKILNYWITGEVSPCIKESIVKIITHDKEQTRKKK